MTELMDGQVSMFDQDIWSGKMSPEPSVPTKGKTLQRSLKKQSVSQSRKPPMWMCLKKDGPQADASTMKWEAGVLPGEFSMHSFGEHPISLYHNGVGVSYLSQILEDSPHQRYSLSAKACQGILNRANRRGKKLPEMLEKALVEQSLAPSKSEVDARVRDYKDATDLVVAGVDCRNATEIPGQNITLQSSCCHNINSGNVVRVKHIVRRLTPLECERLQGFPDGWTDIGEWVDSKGKKHKEADSPRYKALGNSIAIPPWKWVLKRLCACYERDATMASLFDGIGGFPYIWEQLNGKGSCLWASEIEEFPIAVTKSRFGGGE